jgi:signal transduction histidine kinase
MRKHIAACLGPRSEGADSARQRFLMNMVILGLAVPGVFFALAMAVMWIIDQAPITGALAGVGTQPFYWLAYWLSRRGRVRMAAYIVVVILFLMMVGANYQLGVGHVILVGYAMVTLTAGILIGTCAAMFFALLSVGAHLIIGAAQTAGVLMGALQPETTVIADGVGLGLGLVVLVIFNWLSNRELNRMLRRERELSAELRHQQGELEQRVEERTAELTTANRQLEREVVERKRAEEGLQQLNSQLEQRVEERTHELAQANQRLAGLDRLKSQFISDVSHELRTPVGNIRLYLQLLERGKPAKYERYLAVVKTQTEQLMRLIEDILYFSQLELDETKLEFVTVDLNAWVEQAIAAYRPRAEAAGLELIFEPDPNLIPVRAVHTHLAQVISQLADNAIKYTAAGWVRVRTRLDDERRRVCLEVTDSGMGIAAEDLPHVFERFYRGQGVGSSTTPGTGLGLALVQEITALHGGEMEVESEAGAGSTFRVWLPMGNVQFHGDAL